MSCSVDGCTRPVRARGWCSLHYDRWLHNGHPTATAHRGHPDEVRQEAIRIAATDGVKPATDATGVPGPTIYYWLHQAGLTAGHGRLRSRAVMLASTYASPDVEPITPDAIAAHTPTDGWQQDAACRGTDPALWFPDQGVPTASLLAICHACPVRLDCAATHLDEPYGIWGGMTGAQRRQVRRRAAAAGWTPRRQEAS